MPCMSLLCAMGSLYYEIPCMAHMQTQTSGTHDRVGGCLFHGHGIDITGIDMHLYPASAREGMPLMRPPCQVDDPRGSQALTLAPAEHVMCFGKPLWRHAFWHAAFAYPPPGSTVMGRPKLRKPPSAASITLHWYNWSIMSSRWMKAGTSVLEMNLPVASVGRGGAGDANAATRRASPNFDVATRTAQAECPIETFEALDVAEEGATREALRWRGAAT